MHLVENDKKPKILLDNKTGRVYNVKKRLEDKIKYGDDAVLQ